MMTQSVGVPLMAKRRSSTSRRRKGSLSDSECDTPLWSVSGATIQTSSDSAAAMRSATPRPGAWMPSSLVTRMRTIPLPLAGRGRGGGRGHRAQPSAWWRAGSAAGGTGQVRPRPATPTPLGLRPSRPSPQGGGMNAGASRFSLDPPHPAHVRRERVRHRDAAVLVLIVLHHGDEGATDGDAGAVQRVDETRAFPLLRAIAGVHAPRLEIGADRARRDLAIGPLPRQPDLDVVGLGRGEAHVAGAQRHDAIGQIEALEHFLGAAEHALVLVRRLLRRCDRDELALGELVLPQHAPRVLAGSARLGAKARGERGHAEREFVFGRDGLADEVY